VWSENVGAVDPVTLFKYSALTWNSHRVHYDVEYSRTVEMYPDLVVHGPLLCTLLLDMYQRRSGRSAGFSFTYRAVRPLFVTDTIALWGTTERKGGGEQGGSVGGGESQGGVGGGDRGDGGIRDGGGGGDAMDAAARQRERIRALLEAGSDKMTIVEPMELFVTNSDQHVCMRATVEPLRPATSSSKGA